MVIDTSALLAILFHEPEWKRMARALDLDPYRVVSAASVFESSIVVMARLGADGLDELDLMLTRIGAEIRPFGAGDLGVARQAYQRFGKGRHPAALNFGDCFAYALATTIREPLLFKGNDFSQTDVLVANY